MRNKQGERRVDLRMCGLLALQWLVMLVLAQPLGGAEFAINDDWAHKQAMEALVQRGQIVIPDWTATNFIGLMAWAAPWAWIGGPSYEVLRCSTMLAGLLGMWALYGLLRQLDASAVLAMFVAALFAAHPIYLALSTSFMTDVPFVALSVLALWCMLRYHNGSAPRDLAWALMFASWALLIRQTGIALFIAFALAHGLQARPGATRRAGLVLIWGLLLLWAYPAILKSQQLMPAMRDAASAQVAVTLARPWLEILLSIGNWVLRLLLYLGMGAALPLLAIAGMRWRLAGRRDLMVWVSIAGTALVLAWWLSRFGSIRMPLLGSDWARTGLGQRLGTGVLPDQTSEMWRFWSLLTVTALAGSAVAVCVLVRVTARQFGAWRLRETIPFAFVLLMMALLLQWAPSLLLTSVYDRYTLPLLPPFVALLVWASGRSRQALHEELPAARWIHASLGVMVVAASLLGAALLHDYFAWNRVRWDWLRALPVELGVAPTEIQGGFEYSAELLYKGGFATPGPHGWFLDPKPYAISMGPIHGREIMQVRQVSVWLPFSPAKIYLTRLPP